MNFRPRLSDLRSPYPAPQNLKEINKWPAVLLQRACDFWGESAVKRKLSTVFERVASMAFSNQHKYRNMQSLPVQFPIVARTAYIGCGPRINSMVRAQPIQWTRVFPGSPCYFEDSCCEPVRHNLNMGYGLMVPQLIFNQAYFGRIVCALSQANSYCWLLQVEKNKACRMSLSSFQALPRNLLNHGCQAYA